MTVLLIVGGVVVYLGLVCCVLRLVSMNGPDVDEDQR